jgi:hypothetical protein
MVACSDETRRNFLQIGIVSLDSFPKYILINKFLMGRYPIN